MTTHLRSGLVSLVIVTCWIAGCDRSADRTLPETTESAPIETETPASQDPQEIVREPIVYISGAWQERTVEVDGRSYPVGVWVPDAWQGNGRGLVFLHGLGECGTDGKKQLTVGLPRHVSATPEAWPFVVIAPQKPDGASAWEDHTNAVLAAIDQVIDEGLVDPERLAITGLSQGGHGTMQIAAAHTDRFQAAAPVCGYINNPTAHRYDGLWTDATDESVQALARSLATMPVWLFHGGRDNVVPAGESVLLDRLVRDAGGEVQLTIFPDDDHNSWDSAYGGGDLGPWLIEQTK